ncbi:hypothetical protein TNCV_1387831 [Trichonephila clavipes]|nr:hypothetical protein TNCV_1387831 [Trichonephila clavipes]
MGLTKGVTELLAMSRPRPLIEASSGCEVYLSTPPVEFKTKSIKTKFPTPDEAIEPQTMTESPPCLTTGPFGSKAVFGFLHKPKSALASINSTLTPPQNSGGTELKRTVTCMVLKATANDRRISSPLP